MHEACAALEASDAAMSQANAALEAANARIADLEAQLVKANDAWLRLSQAKEPECQACGDGITAHDPGVCGNCFAMKYRDKQPAQTERALTDDFEKGFQRVFEAYSKPRDQFRTDEAWALFVYGKVIDALTPLQKVRALLTAALPASGATE
jgi:hypothetical protein